MDRLDKNGLPILTGLAKLRSEGRPQRKTILYSRPEPGREAEWIKSHKPPRPCPICLMRPGDIKHHLIPRSTIPSVDRGAVYREAIDVSIKICQKCHVWLHITFSHEELVVAANTKAKLLALPQVRKRSITPMRLKMWEF